MIKIIFPIQKTFDSYLLLLEKKLRIIILYLSFVKIMQPISEELYKKIVESSKK